MNVLFETAPMENSGARGTLNHEKNQTPFKHKTEAEAGGELHLFSYTRPIS
jgi:hypothetical protein